MKKKLPLNELLGLCTVFIMGLQTLNAQNNTTLSQEEQRPIDCLTQAPDLKWENEFQKQIAEYKQSLSKGTAAASYLIPVIVHLVYNGNTEATIGTGANLKAAQITAQIDALNDAFAGFTKGNSTLPAPFAAVDANDIPIRFCLALIDKNGATMSEPGIERISFQSKSWSDPVSLAGNATNVQNYFTNTIKPATIWDPTKYFNIWLGDFLPQNGGGLIGYATFPSGTTNTGLSGFGSATTDGVVMASRCFGDKDKFAAGYYSRDAYAYGITTVHEAGHWLGLRHISGDGTCGDDYCNDTPKQKGGNGGCANGLNWNCPTYPFQANQCTGNTNGEMFQDYMDYSDDRCRSIFTADQKTRMMTTMANGTYRKLLGTHGLCTFIATGLSQVNNPNFVTIAPNPNAGNFNVSFDSNTKENYTLELRNVLGQVIYQETLTNHIGVYSKQFDVSEFSKGMYMISLTDGKNEVVKKIIVY